MKHAKLVLAAAGAVALVVGAALHAADDPAADLKKALAASDAKQYTVAVPLWNGLKKRVPELADYAAWYLAQAQSDQQKYDAVPATLETVFSATPKSPLRGRASLLAASAYIQLNKPQEAVRVLKAYASETTAPQTEMALADAYAAAGDKANAASYYQRVYFGYPQSPAAPRAWTVLQQLSIDLGKDYPPVLPKAMLTRASKVLEAGDAKGAQKEFEEVAPKLAGAERDVARVRIGEAMYRADKNAEAYDYLTKLEVGTDEADAERLLYIAQSARRLKKLDVMDQTAARDGELHPQSHFTVQALTAAGNEHLKNNEIEAYEPLYQACYERAPGDAGAELCHWKVTWAHYLRRDKDAAAMLRDHVRTFPDGDQASAALYFLSRLAEKDGDIPAARTYAGEVAREYPNLFYATQAKERLAKLGKGPGAEGTEAFLKTVAFPLRSRTQDFSVTPAAQARIARAKWLAKAGASDLAESELRYGANQGEQAPVLAMELAKLLGGSDPAQAMRYIKRYARGYLMVPIPTAPDEFWRMAFPLPYRTSLERYAQENGVDPFLMAALVRQESEFDVKAVSSSNARGLSQILPSTGKDLAKRLKVTYSASKLFEPDYNLRLGTYYVSWLMKQLDGSVPATLASYNAGMTHAKAWLRWAEYREPAEFIESIPFTQTHDYVQAVLRNAAAYREIYGTQGPGVTAQ